MGTVALAALFTALLAMSVTYSLASARSRRELPSRSRAKRVPVSADWEKDGEEWKQRNAPDPEPGIPDVPEPIEDDARRASLWEGINQHLGRKVECPKCSAENAERRKAGQDPIPMRFRVRNSDRALYCYRHDETVYPMSEDTVIKHDPRFHRQEPDDQPEAA